MSEPLRWADAHCHLNDPKFAGEEDEIVVSAGRVGVDRLIVVSYDHSTLLRAVKLAERFPQVYATVGIHPHDAKSWNPAIEEDLISSLAAPKVRAIGEIGLDYHYDFSPREQQKAVFEAQLNLAVNHQIPVVLHVREAFPDFLAIMAPFEGRIAKRLVHCFTEGPEILATLLERGYSITIGGAVTFKKLEGLRESARVIPLDRLMVETDCPYMAPVPHRGKRNEPAFLPLVGAEIARLKNHPVSDLARATYANSQLFFGF